MFSSRVPSDLGPNAVAAAVERMRLSGRGFDDLTVSNPTLAAIDYPPDLLAPLGASTALVYDPSHSAQRRRAQRSRRTITGAGYTFRHRTWR